MTVWHCILDILSPHHVQFTSFTADLVPLLVTLGLLYPVANIISYICREKEFRQKELMKMMSVTEWQIGSSWFFSFACLYIIGATLCAVVSVKLYENSDAFLIWIFWVLTYMSLIVFAMFLSTFSSKTTRVRTLFYFYLGTSTIFGLPVH